MGSGTSTTLFVYNAIMHYQNSIFSPGDFEDSTEAQPDTGAAFGGQLRLRAGLSVSSTRCFFSVGG